MNPTDIFKQLSGMQRRMAELQDRLAAQQVDGESGGGLVRVVVNGKYEAKQVIIDPSLAGEDLKVIGDLVASAFNSAARQVQSIQAGQLGDSIGMDQLPEIFKGLG